MRPCEWTRKASSSRFEGTVQPNEWTHGRTQCKSETEKKLNLFANLANSGGGAALTKVAWIVIENGTDLQLPKNITLMSGRGRFSRGIGSRLWSLQTSMAIVNRASHKRIDDNNYRFVTNGQVVRDTRGSERQSLALLCN
ncbi:hypothetical protein HN011_005839 [Eciton burchellii]|nr:hypothetical protein HN011_005839 [Eciton burchellii]